MNIELEILSTILDIFYTFLEIFCLYRYVNFFYEQKNRKKFLKNRNHLFTILLIICSVVIILGLNSIVLTSPYTVVVVLLLNIILIRTFWKCDIVNVVAIVGGYFLALSISGSIEVSLTGIVGGEKLILLTINEQGEARIVYMLLFGTNWYIINTLFLYWLKKRKINAYGIKYLAYISIIGIAGSVFIMTQMLSGFNVNITVILYGFVFFIAICIFLTYYVVKSRYLQTQMRLLDLQNDILTKKYQQISEFYIMNAKLQHDFKHHLYILHYMLKNGEEDSARQYIESIQEPVVESSIKTWTSIDVVDVILNEMKKKAGAKGILLKIKTNIIPQNMSVEKKDMCILFANLLDNAVEAASKKIDLNIQYVRRMLFIEIRNDYQITPIVEKGRLVTTKKDKWLHGFGMQNIEQVVCKYNGSLEYKIQDNIFCMNIMICE